MLAMEARGSVDVAANWSQSQRRALPRTLQTRLRGNWTPKQLYALRQEPCRLRGLGRGRSPPPPVTRAAPCSGLLGSPQTHSSCRSQTPQLRRPATRGSQLAQRPASKPAISYTRAALLGSPQTAPTTRTATAAIPVGNEDPQLELQPRLPQQQPATAPPRPNSLLPHPTPLGPPSRPVLTRRSLLSAAAAGVVAASAVTAAASLGPLVLPASASAAAVSGRPPPEMGFAPRVVEFTLDNGLHFIVLPRRNAPVVSCHTYANVGAWNESPGCTGMAHLLEHMAFKGTPRLGSVDFRREAPLLDALDEAFYELRDAKASGAPRISALRSRLRSLQDQAAALTVPNAFGAALQRAGGVGLNATTSHDQTRYFVSLPSNKLELWMALEAERFRAPVFRELYSEKAVIEEERRLRVDNTAMGRYQQEFALSSLGNNYRRPVIGFEEDFDAIGRREVQAFFNRFYGPANITVAIVGDADPRAVRRMAERYWGDWSGPEGYQVLPRGKPLLDKYGNASGNANGNSNTKISSEDAGSGGSTAVTAVKGAAAASVWWGGDEDPRPEAFVAGSRTSLRAPARSGPAALLGYYRPAMTSREGVVLEVLSDVLAGGRTSRLVSELVLSGRALSASLVPSYPGELHAGLALVYGVPREGEGPEAVASLLQSQLTVLAEDGVTPSDLARVQRATRAGLLSAAQSNSAMAAALASYHVSSGSWRGLLDELDLVTQLRPAELRDLAGRLFHPRNCFTGYVLRA